MIIAALAVAICVSLLFALAVCRSAALAEAQRDQFLKDDSHWLGVGGGEVSSFHATGDTDA